MNYIPQNTRKHLATLVAAAFGLLLVASAVRADVIVGNLPSTSSTPTTISNSSSAGVSVPSGTDVYNWKSIGFTMGAASYDVTSLTLTLQLGSTTATPGVTVGIYADDGSGKPDGDLSSSDALYTFSDPSFTGGSTTDYANYTFTVPGGETFALSADTTYWIVVSQTSISGQTVRWAIGTGYDGNGSKDMNPASVAASAGTWYGNTASTDLTSGAESSTKVPYFELDGTAVAIPEASTCAAVLGAAAGLLAFARRFRRRGQTDVD